MKEVYINKQSDVPDKFETNTTYVIGGNVTIGGSSNHADVGRLRLTKLSNEYRVLKFKAQNLEEMCLHLNQDGAGLDDEEIEDIENQLECFTDALKFIKANKAK